MGPFSRVRRVHHVVMHSERQLGEDVVLGDDVNK
jgi:hypothetical protein